MFSRHWRAASAVLLLLSTAATTGADTITGRVVDANGLGVPGVDIDVKSLSGGGDPPISNDGTDANGFFVTTLPPGVYRVFFYPPPPPVTTHLTATVDDVVVVGTKDMGVIQLEPGVGIYGRCIDPSGIPVGGVNLDVIDVPTGDNLLLKGGTTSAFGDFGVAAPANAIHLDFDPLGVVGRTLAPRRIDLAPSGDLQLGDVVLQNGFVLSGTLVNSSGGGLSGIDFDVFRSPSREPVFTPHDNSGTGGAFAMVLAPDTYDIEICPALTRRLVAAEVEGLVLGANTNLGMLTLVSGVVLSGTVRDVAGSPVAGADVNVRNATTGVSVFLCGDNTSATGTYAVVVPSGSMNVGFALPGQHGTTGEDFHAAVPILGDTRLDGVLPAPSPGFGGTPLSGLAPLTTTFTDLSTGAITAWSWSFGDGATSSLASPVHTYALPGTYAVALTVSGPGGPMTLNRPGYVSVLPPPPVAAFVGTPTAGAAPLTVAFTNQSTGSITSHAWTFGDGGTSTLASPSHTYAAAGTYTVALTETGPGGSNTRTRVGYVVVNEPPPVAEFVGTPTSGLRPLTVAFTNLSTGAITGHAWSFGDGTTSTLASPSHTYTTAGTYTVALTETGPGGSSTRTRIGYIVVGEPPPVAEFSASPVRGRSPLPVVFQDLSSGAVTSWLWDFGDGTTSTERNPTHLYRFGGLYTVRLTVTGPGGSDQRVKPSLVAVRGPRR